DILRHMSMAAPHKYADLGQRIRRARKRAGISQERLSASVGITRRHLIRLENGEHLPGRTLRDRIAEETGAERTELAADEDDEEPHPAMSLDDFLRLRVRALVAEEKART